MKNKIELHLKHYIWLFLPLLYSCHEEQDIPVVIDVNLHIAGDNHTAPLTVGIEDNTKNADSYHWTFEGGSPASSDERAPGSVTFAAPGEHAVTLEAWNAGNKAEKTYTVRVDSAVVAAFDLTPYINNYAPATFLISNHSSGGTSYQWQFPGGTPSAYTGATPPPVEYKEAGTYEITLSVSNGSASFSAKQTVSVRESLAASFRIVPSFEDEDDMEAPLRATFDVKLQGVESLRWSCEGATISRPDQTDASAYFPQAGTYEVWLEVSNGKDSLRVSQSISVKANSNLRTHHNIRLGINTASDSLPVCYSTRLRRAFKINEVPDSLGSQIDIVYLGFNDSFTHNMFVSPSALSETPLPELPSARPTYFVNKIEDSGLRLTPAQFNAMQTDALLRNINIPQRVETDAFFSGDLLPRVVLFETADGRKGAILVKAMVSDGTKGSYILVDIKVQKND
ncbi:MAG: PKD domain-containing protein [Tannerella sp.]|nr:PKD domain-containing protein [Tannerella sp.]